MQRVIHDFPSRLIKFRTMDWVLNVRGRAGAEGIDGSGQVVVGLKPRWEASLTVMLSSRAHILVWRAFLARMRGRVNVMRLPLADPLGISGADMGLPASDWPEAAIDGFRPHARRSEFAGGALFSTGAGYAYEPVLTGVVASAGATSITADARDIGDALQPGHFISTSETDWLYRVTGIYGTPAARTYTIEPQLRASISASTIIFCRARARMAFATDMEASPELELIPLSTPRFSLFEVLNR